MPHFNIYPLNKESWFAMIKTIRIRALCFIMATAMTLTLSTCAVFQPKPADEMLKERFHAYMAAKINNDWAAVYTYFEPSYRENITQEAFAGKPRALQFTSYTIKSIAIYPSGKEAEIHFTFNATLKNLEVDFVDHKSTEKWINTGNQWFVAIDHDPKKGIFQ
jgi:hypothetical protein